MRNDKIRLTSGKTLDPNRGFIGLNENGEISDGYDAQFVLEGNDSFGEYDPENDWNHLSFDEQIELANLMLDRWIGFIVKVGLRKKLMEGI